LDTLGGRASAFESETQRADFLTIFFTDYKSHTLSLLIFSTINTYICLFVSLLPTNIIRKKYIYCTIFNIIIGVEGGGGWGFDEVGHALVRSNEEKDIILLPCLHLRVQLLPNNYVYRKNILFLSLYYCFTIEST
jgi:hypothetical protein